MRRASRSPSVRAARERLGDWVRQQGRRARSASRSTVRSVQGAAGRLGRRISRSPVGRTLQHAAEDLRRRAQHSPMGRALSRSRESVTTAVTNVTEAAYRAFGPLRQGLGLRRGQRSPGRLPIGRDFSQDPPQVPALPPPPPPAVNIQPPTPNQANNPTGTRPKNQQG